MTCMIERNQQVELLGGAHACRLHTAELRLRPRPATRRERSRQTATEIWVRHFLRGAGAGGDTRAMRSMSPSLSPPATLPLRPVPPQGAAAAATIQPYISTTCQTLSEYTKHNETALPSTRPVLTIEMNRIIRR